MDALYEKTSGVFSTIHAFCSLSLSLCAHAVAAPAPVPNGASAKDIALAHVRSLANSPTATLTVEAESTVTLEHLGETISEFKIFDATAGVPHLVTIDATGTVVDHEKAFGRDNGAKIARYGSLSPALFESVQQLIGQDTLDVSIWIEGFDNVPYDRKTQPGTNEHETAFQKWKADRQEHIRKFRGPIENRLRAAGIDISGVDDMTPALSASLTKGQLIALSHFPGVAVYAATKPEIQSADQRNMIKMGDANNDSVWEGPVDIAAITSNGVSRADGPFVKLGQIEPGPIDFKGMFADVFIGGGTNRTDVIPGCHLTTDPTSLVYQHATIVASVMAGMRTTSNPKVWGVAPNAYISMANNCSDDPPGDLAFSPQLDWAQHDGAKATNVSFGGQSLGKMSVSTRIFDTHVRDSAMVIVVAAGNSGSSTEPWVVDPAISYGVISVGNSDDIETNGIGSSAWNDDRMRRGSSWQNPISPHNDRELPDLTASGVGINVWSPPLGAGVRQETRESGTSLSAPVVTAVAGLMAQEYAIFAGWPELTKAAIIATAWENIEGPANSLASYTDDRDGAGNVNAARAYRLAKSRSSGLASVGFPTTDLRAANGAFSVDAATSTTNLLEVTANAGDLVRFALSWSVDSTYANYDTAPSADLDLTIVCPTGCTLPSSAKWDSTVEMVEFTAPVTGIYKANVHPYRVNSYTYWGIASDVLPSSALSSPRDKGVVDLPVSIYGDI